MMLQSKHDVIKYFCLYLLGFGSISLTTFVVISQQSSLNIENGLGTTSLAVNYLFILLTSLFVVPTLLWFISARKALIASDLAQLTYILANFYPTYYTLIPGAALYGIGRSFYWSTMTLFCLYFARHYTKYGTKSTDFYFSKFNAYTLAGFGTGQILGNLISYAIFESAAASKQQNYDLHINNSVLFSTIVPASNFTSPQPKYFVKDICGANDCQVPTIVAETLSTYQPPSKEVFYLTLGILVVIHIAGTLVHFLFLPEFIDVSDAEKKKPESNNVYERDDSDTYKQDNSCNLTVPNQTTVDYSQNVDTSATSTNAEESEIKAKNLLITAFIDFKKTFKFVFFSPQALLLATTWFHFGSNLQFVWSEITRSYVSCIYGLSKIGVAMSVHGVSFFVFFLFMPKLITKFGRVSCVAVGSTINLAVYLFCLLWVPDEDTSIGMLYGVLFLWGITDTVFQTVSIEASVIHFRNDNKLSSAAWTFWAHLGFFVQCLWSSSVCVRYKIYVMIGILATVVATFFWAEFRFRKSQKIQQKTQVTTISS